MPENEDTPKLSPARAVLNWAELVLLFVAVPTAFWWTRTKPGAAAGWLERLGVTGRLAEAIAGGRLMIPTLLLFAVVCVGALVADRSFTNRRLWNLRGAREDLPRMLLFFFPLASIASLLVFLFQHDSPMVAALADRGLHLPTLREGADLFVLPRERTGLWLMIMLLYPIFSVWPQEALYRAFFHHRYRTILRTPIARIAVGAFVFGYMHIVFLNWLAPVMCLAGGLLFAWTYERSMSTLAATTEHALWGCWVFTIGLGWYFFGGNMNP